MKVSVDRVLFCVASLLILSCTSDRSYLAHKNTAISTLHQLAVVTDPSSEQARILDTVDFCFGGAYPLLPRPEPYFDLRLFYPDQLLAERTRRELKAYIILSNLDTAHTTTKWLYRDIGENVINEKPRGVKVIQNKWAQDQLVAYIHAPSDEELIEEIKRSCPALMTRFEQFYAPQANKIGYLNGVNVGLSEKIEEKFDLRMEIPRGYQEAAQEENFLWLRKDQEKGINNLMIHTYPYTNAKQLSESGIKEKLNELGKRHISSSSEGSYMQINDRDLPVFFSEKSIDGNYAVQVEGIWEMQNDFMGGPYVAYFIVDEEKGRIVLLEGVLFAPGEKKRNQMIVQKLLLQGARFN